MSLILKFHCCHALKYFSLLSLAIVLAFSLTLTASGAVTVDDLTYLMELSPGEVYRDYLEVKNTGRSAERVSIYLTDYTLTRDGAARYPDAGSLPRSNAGWIALDVDPKPVEIPGGETIRVPYTVRVPEDEDLAGTYWSMVNVIVEPSTGIEEPSKLHVKQTFGYGIQTITNIGESGERMVKILGLDQEKREGENFLRVKVKNTGERMLEPVVSLELYDRKGELRSTGNNLNGKKIIYPDSSTSYRVPIRINEPGRYEALLIVNNLDRYVWGTQTTVEISPE